MPVCVLNCVKCIFNLFTFQLFDQITRELVWYAVAETCALKTLVRSVTHAHHALLWPQEGKYDLFIYFS